MTTRLPLHLFTLAATLGLSVAQAADKTLLQASCSLGEKQAELVVSPAGDAHLTMRQGDASFGCSLRLTALEGPPFSDNATGMLVLELERTSCDSKAQERKLQRDVFLHIEDPGQPAGEGMAIIERRAGVFQCKLGPVDMQGLTTLHDKLAAQPKS